VTPKRRRPEPAGGRPAPAPDARTEPRLAWWEPALLVALWLGFAATVSGGHLVTTYDSFRDMAATHAILRGDWAGDPTLPGLPAWYPALQAALFAAVSKLTTLTAVQVHGTSLFWFGWTLPVCLHVLVRQSFGRAAAWWSLAWIGLGSQWWLTHAAMPMPSIQGVALGALTLIAWDRARSGGTWAAAGCGVAGALALMFHPLCGGMAIAAVLAHGAGSLVLRGARGGVREHWHAARQALIAAGSAALLSAPLLVPVLSGPVLNPAPRLWFGPEMRTAAFALHAGTPLVLPLGLAGLVLCARDGTARGWLVGYAAVALVGTLAGYAGHEWGWPVPYVIPHEFQWHLQLAWCIAAAWCVLRLAAWTARTWRRLPLAPWAVMLALSALALGPSLARLGESARYPMRLDQSQVPLRRVAEALAALGPPGAIVASEPELAYYFAGFAGTRAQLLPDGHMNPRARVELRSAALRVLLQSEDETRFRAVLRQLPVDLLFHAPADTSQIRRLDQRYAAWTVVRPVPLPEPTLRLYRVLRDTTQAAHAPETEGR
jgi:hypothetical protein